MATITKDRILKTAQDLFYKRGVRDVSINDICRKLCISKKTFYQFYSQKEDLVGDIVTYRIENEKQKFEKLSEGKTFIEIFNSVFELISKKKLMDPNRKLASEIWKYYPETFKKNSAAKEKLIRSFFIKVFRDGVEEGYLRPEMNDEATMLLLSLMHNKMVTYLENEDEIGAIKKIPFKSLLKAFETIVTRTLLTEKGYKEYVELYKKRVINKRKTYVKENQVCHLDGVCPSDSVQRESSVQD